MVTAYSQLSLDENDDLSSLHTAKVKHTTKPTLQPSSRWARWTARPGSTTGPSGGAPSSWTLTLSARWVKSPPNEAFVDPATIAEEAAKETPAADDFLGADDGRLYGWFCQ